MIEAAPGNGAATSKKEQLAMKHTRTNEARWDEARKRWRIDVQRDGKRRSFYSAIPGRKGKAECHYKADEWLEEGGEGGNLRCGILLERCLETEKSTTSYSNWKQHKSIHKVHLLPAIEHKKIGDITEQNLQDIINRAFNSGLSFKTLSNIRGAIVGFLKFCRKSGHTNLRPEDLTIPRGAKRGEKRILQPDDLRILFTSTSTTWRDKIIPDWFVHAYRFQVANGLRPGELIALKWRDIGDNVIKINGSINVHNERTSGKNNNARRKLAVTDLTRQILADQRSMLNAAGIISPYVFCRKDGSAEKEVHLLDCWKRYCKHNGIEIITLYELRHTFVSINKETPEALLKKQVGHSKDMDTNGIYGHEMDGDLERMAGYVDAAFDTILDRTFDHTCD
jgi:integrase